MSNWLCRSWNPDYCSIKTPGLFNQCMTHILSISSIFSQWYRTIYKHGNNLAGVPSERKITLIVSEVSQIFAAEDLLISIVRSTNRTAVIGSEVLRHRITYSCFQNDFICVFIRLRSYCRYYNGRNSLISKKELAHSLSDNPFKVNIKSEKNKAFRFFNIFSS